MEVFTFKCIDAEFTEDQYLEARRLILIAASLFGDGMGGELGQNQEYERGMLELICDRIGIPMEQKHEVRDEIYAVARDRLRRNARWSF